MNKIDPFAPRVSLPLRTVCRVVLLSALTANVAGAAVERFGPALPATRVDAVATPPLARAASGGLRRHPVRVDEAAIAAGVRAGRLELPSVDAKPLFARGVSGRIRSDGLHVVSGVVDTGYGPQSMLLVFGRDGAFGLIPQRAGSPLRLETRHGETALIEGLESLPDFLVNEPDVALPTLPTAAERALRQRQELAKAAGDPVIDVVVVYSPALVQAWGSNAAALTRIAYLEEITNQAYIDSQVGQSIHVLARQLVDYPFNNDNDDALDAISGNANSPTIRNEVQRLRTQYGADLIKLIRNFDRSTQNSCGVGWLGGYSGNPFTTKYAYSVTSDRGFGNDNCGEWTFAHELGHNMGSHHDVDNADGEDGAYAYSHGWRQTLSPTSGFGTIMAYTISPQVRIGRFSNPLQSDCLAQPCGDALTADNSRSLNNTGSMVAGITTALPTTTLPLASIDDVTVVETDSGTANARLTVTLSKPATATVTLTSTTMQGNATSNIDFTTATPNITIPVGQSSATVDVTVRGDTTPEIDEVFALNLLTATNARIVDGQGVVTITDNEATPTLAVADASIGEGDAGTKMMQFFVSLTAPSTAPVTFDFNTHEYAAGPTAATAGTDYDLASQAGVTIAAGATSALVAVPVRGDIAVEEDERFYVMINNVVGAEVGDIIATGRIRNDDGGAVPPTITIADRSLTEGDAGTAVMAFTVTLSAPAPATVTFGATTANGSAAAGSDYDAVASAALQIPAGQSTGTVNVPVRGDTTDENDETFTVTLHNVAGATVADGSATGTILDDDNAAPLPPFNARGDRAVIRENAAATTIAVLGNDVFTPSRLTGGTFAITTAPTLGTATIDTGGSADPGNDRIVYTPTANAGGDDTVGYRLCEGSGGRCVDGSLSIVVRPHLDVAQDTATGAGFTDLAMDDLRALPDAVFVTSVLVRPTTLTLPLVADTTPETPWDSGRAGTAAHLAFFDVASPRLLVDARSRNGGDVDVYVGVDTNGNLAPDLAELRCTSATAATIERCEMAVAATPGVTRYWIMVHSRSGAQDAQLDIVAGAPVADAASKLVATGPGHLVAGDAFPVRLGWDYPALLPGESAYAWVLVQATPSSPATTFPVRIDRVGGSAVARAIPEDSGGIEVALAIGGGQDRLYVDVPTGATQLRVQTLAPDGVIDLQLTRATAPVSSPDIAPAPATGAGQVIRNGLTGTQETLVSNPAAGRWYVEPINASAFAHRITVRANVVATGVTPPRSGGYFNPARSGHGLLLYPAGGDWAGLWYTYLQDGSATWYYLQGAAPAGNGVWEGGLYRAAWNGTGNRLKRVGHAQVTPTGPDAFVFSYLLDGEAGAEPLVALGRGCPTLSGSALDVSSHWFNPARSGTGYSVQMWTNYEFYAAFVYDGRGVPRFLTAENGSFAGADAVLQLDQLHGFCPLCTRTGNPQRFDVGNLRRRFAGGTFAEIELDAIWTDGVPGTWTADEAIQTLGGPGTTQGCQP